MKQAACRLKEAFQAQGTRQICDIGLKPDIALLAFDSNVAKREAAILAATREGDSVGLNRIAS
ncbi:hypothetical protein ACE10Z_36000 [Bradyrhizobium sp. Pha-3]|uniref:hypothetical protein n=1 Tax=Bradyrhizobium sp. Pha-3 TaxID=208375 RepID=UPI0035D40257